MLLPDCGDDITSGHCRDNEEPPPKSMQRVRGVRSAAFARTPLARAVSRTSYIAFAGKRNVVATNERVRFVQGGSLTFKIEIFACFEHWTTWCQDRKVAVEPLFLLEKLMITAETRESLFHAPFLLH
jgi:hypothetical protein